MHTISHSTNSLVLYIQKMGGGTRGKSREGINFQYRDKYSSICVCVLDMHKAITQLLW